MDERVLVDTCIWASFFSKPGSPEKRTVDDLLDADRVAMIGAILGEVLLGFRRKDQADWVGSRLALAHYADVTAVDWRSAADLGRTLAANGHKIPLTDLAVAAVALRLSVSVYSTDPDFDLIPDLHRYQPD